MVELFSRFMCAADVDTCNTIMRSPSSFKSSSLAVCSQTETVYQKSPSNVLHSSEKMRGGRRFSVFGAAVLKLPSSVYPENWG